MINRRAAVVTALILTSTFVMFLNSDLISRAYSNTNSRLAIPSLSVPLPSAVVNPSGDSGVAGDNNGSGSGSGGGGGGASPLSPQVLTYFDQAFSSSPPAAYDFPALRQQCARTKWRDDGVYLQCVGIAAGLTSIMSQVKVCLKMAFDAGTGLVLPAMPLRNSTHLTEFNFLNPDAYMPYDEWFDAEHLVEQVGRVCPQMNIVHPAKLDVVDGLIVKRKWAVNLSDAPGYHQFQSYFWTGRPFRDFFDEQYARLLELDSLNPDNGDSIANGGGGGGGGGITIISIASNFLLFRITDDPTGQDLKLWNDLSHLIRFPTSTRELVRELLDNIPRPFYGIHFRVEADTIWSSLEHQLAVDLDALDRAWELYGGDDGDGGRGQKKKPLVYLACGDQDQVSKFVDAGHERGWDVTHKWRVAESVAASHADTTIETGTSTLSQKISSLPFDFQGAVDMGVMIMSDFFVGITGSAFSSTIGNARDVTGRYRGSSFVVVDDGGARTHLFNDGDASLYACCL